MEQMATQTAQRANGLKFAPAVPCIALIILSSIMTSVHSIADGRPRLLHPGPKVAVAVAVQQHQRGLCSFSSQACLSVSSILLGASSFLITQSPFPLSPPLHSPISTSLSNPTKTTGLSVTLASTCLDGTTSGALSSTVQQIVSPLQPALVLVNSVRASI
ncbi:hypothetical protein FALCPG4_014245 [Fusarium falciforme]